MRNPVINKLQEIEPRTVEWLWHEKIPKGRISLIAGDPGIGKSWVSLDIAARVSKGTEWPDGQANKPGNVVLINCEDDFGDTIRPRLEKLGADLDRVFELQGWCSDGSEYVHQMTFDDMDILEKVIDEINPSLIILDPLSAYFNEQTDNYRDTSVRRALRPVAEMIMEKNVAFLMIAHLNKTSDQAGLYRVSGSIQFSGAARTSYLVALDPTDLDRRLMLCIKNNLGPARFGFAYKVNPDNGVHPIEWDPRELREEDLDMIVSSSQRLDEEVRELMKWLAEESKIQKGVLIPGTIRKSAQEGGYSWNTVQKARRAAGFSAVKVNDGWKWISEETPDAGGGWYKE